MITAEFSDVDNTLVENQILPLDAKQPAMNFMSLFYQNLIELKEPQQAFFSARRQFKTKDLFFITYEYLYR